MTDQEYVQMPDYDPDDLDAEDLAPPSWLSELPELDLSMVQAGNPSDPNQWFLQDPGLFPEEGVGGPGVAGTIPPGTAIDSMKDDIRDGTVIPTATCLMQQRIKRGVLAKYFNAKECCLAIPKEFLHHITDWGKVPRGVLLYNPGHENGHVWTSLGGGPSITTDWPSGLWGRVNGRDLMVHWGYDPDNCFWSPIINDVKVWSPKQKRRPPVVKHPTRGDWFDAEIRQLAIKRKNLHENGRHDDAVHVNDALRQLLKVDVRMVAGK